MDVSRKIVSNLVTPSIMIIVFMKIECLKTDRLSAFKYVNYCKNKSIKIIILRRRYHELAITLEKKILF